MKNRIKFGEIKPNGWLKKELEENMEGCIGHLDALVPHLIREHDIYGKERLGRHSRLKDLGRNDSCSPEFEGHEDQFIWWNSETQSNWRDGFVRSAMLLDNETYKKQTDAYVEEILKTQDADGYLGIYDEKLRFKCTGENGELWAQSTLLRALLAYCEAGDHPQVFEKVRMAADRIMDGYKMGGANPFQVKEPFAGVGHGLTVVDAFDWLYEITGEKKYEDYALWLYQCYSSCPQFEEDLQLPHVQDPRYIFHGHGVHTFEHIRALIISACADETYKTALAQLTAKLPYYLTPSGAPIGDEWIVGRTADATWTGYEFCSLHELVHTYSLLAQKTGDLLWNEMAEWLYFNGAEGMKHPTESSIMYLKTDNCYTADEHCYPDLGERNPRYKYSPFHQDAAVCCVPNSGRITPYFIHSLMFAWEDGFKIGGYGPCTYSGTYNGTAVSIEQETAYPLDMNVRLKISAQQSVQLSLYLRVPGWASAMIIDGERIENPLGKCSEVRICRVFKEDTMNISFECNIQFRTDFKINTYVTRGPLVYCVPIPAREVVYKTLLDGRFFEKGYISQDRSYETLKLFQEDKETFAFDLEAAKDAKTWDDLKIHGVFQKDGEVCRISMVPMARTILRKVTF